jgi:hypothetical protein
MVWQGNPREGIVLTVAKLFGGMIHGVDTKDGKIMGVKASWDALWNNENPELRRLYRANLVQLQTDLWGMLIIGCLLSGILKKIVEKSAKERGNSTVLDAVINNS